MPGLHPFPENGDFLFRIADNRQNYGLSIGVHQVPCRMDHIVGEHVEQDEAVRIAVRPGYVWDVEIALLDSQSNQIQPGESGALVVERSVDFIRGIEVGEGKGRPEMPDVDLRPLELDNLV